MPSPTPFHERTQALCHSHRWKDWAGYYSVCSYDTTHEREYTAFRHGAGLLDASPLYKYDVRGRDAAALLARVLVRDVRKLKPGRVSYSCWCDDDGKVIDDGTVSCLEPGHYRVTAADPCLEWFTRASRGYDVTIEDLSEALGCLALQGPTSREVLAACSDADLGALKFFGTTAARLGGRAVRISRTGYTGDLGYEIWVDRADALAVWDALVAAGRPHGLEPAGLDALDVARIEAGFVLGGVDYFNARHCMIPSRTSTPDEIGLGWSVDLEREPFIGQGAIRRERTAGARRALVGLEISWEALERLYDRWGLPAALSSAAWRTSLPVYDRDSGKQIGRASSGAWSPSLKRNLALATVDRLHGALGSEVHIEQTVEFVRERVPARVVERPFFDPPRKRA